MDGGYDDGYRECTCFWGTQPGSLVRALANTTEILAGKCILDLGCGDGKNAAYLAKLGAHVDAIDISEIAIQRAQTAWSNIPGIVWKQRDVVDMHCEKDSYDVVVAYGMLHCLQSQDIVTDMLKRMQTATRPGGYNVIATFNNRRQELPAHPNLRPCFLSHSYYVNSYKGWDILVASDSDLRETHPNNNIPHTHAMTRISSRKPIEP